MAKNLFSVPIFFIIFRETIEAAIIVSVLLSFVEQLMSSGALASSSTTTQTSYDENGQPQEPEENVELLRSKRIIKRMRIQIWAGTAAGFGIALAIGAAFIAVFYTKLNDLWGNTEQIWEGVFSIVASILIYIMGMAFLKMDHSRVKWRLKLAQAFGDSMNKKGEGEGEVEGEDDKEMRKKARNGKWALFLLPFITVLREGLEAVVFVGGVSLGQPGTSIPIATIVGLIAGAIVGYIIYRTGSSFALHWFLVASTCVLFLIGAGLLSKGVGYFEYYRFAKKVGGDVSETGNGPGSYQVAGNVWHLTYGNPEPGAVGTNGGAQIANAIFGWNNNATIGTILAYVFFWLAVIAGLVYNKWTEGRVTFFGKGSKAYYRRMEKRQAGEAGAPLDSPPISEQSSGEGSERARKVRNQREQEEELGPAGPRLLKDNRMDSGFSEGEKEDGGFKKVVF